MGSQQLLMILVGVIVVGLIIITCLSMVRTYYEEMNRDLLISTLNDLGVLAQQHNKKPVEQGGGGGEYTNFEIPQQLRSTTAGSINSVVRKDRVDFVALGMEIGRDGKNVVRVTARVDHTGIRITITN